jgi:CHAD domain-containing protein
VWQDRRGAAWNAQRVLPRMVREYFDEARRFLRKDRDPEEFHRMRLAAKRLRYTMELFRPCYGKGLEQRLEALKALQDALGELNDAVATRALLRGRVKKAARAYLRKRAQEKADEFRKLWAENFAAPEREAWWTEFLEKEARAAGAPRKGPRG